MFASLTRLCLAAVRRQKKMVLRSVSFLKGFYKTKKFIRKCQKRHEGHRKYELVEKARENEISSQRKQEMLGRTGSGQ